MTRKPKTPRDYPVIRAVRRQRILETQFALVQKKLDRADHHLDHAIKRNPSKRRTFDDHFLGPVLSLDLHIDILCRELR